MLGINYLKFDPTGHVMRYKNAQIFKNGRGLAFYYFTANSTVVSIPIESNDFQFVFKTPVNNYQEVTIQGQITYQVIAPKQLAESLDFTVNSEGPYLKVDYE